MRNFLFGLGLAVGAGVVYTFFRYPWVALSLAVIAAMVLGIGVSFLITHANNRLWISNISNSQARNTYNLRMPGLPTHGMPGPAGNFPALEPGYNTSEQEPIVFPPVDRATVEGVDDEIAG
jgi:hypothetical protein